MIPGFALAQAQYDAMEPPEVYEDDYSCKNCGEEIEREQWFEDGICHSCALLWCPDCREYGEECPHGIVPLDNEYHATGPRQAVDQ